MVSKSYCAATIGLEALLITVEIDISMGVGIHLVGLPDSAVKESLLRVNIALASCGYRVPGKRIVINLAPADLRKEGSGYDLAIAVGIIMATEQVEFPNIKDYIIMGELALNGDLRAVPGALPIAIFAQKMGYKGCILPSESALEAQDVEGIAIYSVKSIREAIEILTECEDNSKYIVKRGENRGQRTIIQQPNFRDVKGQKLAKRGLEVAAAGGHNLILIGSPGSGKTFMATCLPSILPPMNRAESLETSKIYSIAGHSICRSGLLKDRPFRAPHHSASITSLIGGGPNAIPGEISLAHNGVLYLDEIAEFPTKAIDNLRQPIEDGKVTISRLKYKVTYPSSFMLIASMNPCPCGYYGQGERCRCTQNMINRYMSRVSGPILDRIDMHIFVRAVESELLVGDTVEEESEVIAQRVRKARDIQLERFKDCDIYTNAQMNAAQIREFCQIDEPSKLFLNKAITKLGLSARAYSRILKLSRTIADLDGNPQISLKNISEAIQYRNLDRDTN